MSDEPPVSRRASYITLGCKSNQYDTQALKEQLQRAGYADLDGDGADVFVVNTCTVTEVAATKSRRAIQSLVKRNPGARVIVTGCYVDSNLQDLQGMDGVTLLATNGQKAAAVETFLDEDTVRGGDPVSLSEKSIFSMGISRFDGHTRAFMKVEDGCDINCTYCIIPMVRGNVVSRTIAECEDEARRLVASGHREIVLTGIHLGAFGRGSAAEGETLAGLLDRLAPIPGLERLRISSIEIDEVDDALLRVMRAHDNICPHFHLPLQSGDDEILKRMARRYRQARILEVTDKIKSLWDRVALSTDIIVGFPGETEAHWRTTLDVCRRVGFMKIHIFPYSDRRGTPASEFDGHVPQDVIARRRQELAELEAELAVAYKKQFLGETVTPLLEYARDPETGLLAGVTERYLRVLVDGPDEWKNTLQPVRVTGLNPEVVRGEAHAGTVPAQIGTL